MSQEYRLNLTKIINNLIDKFQPAPELVEKAHATKSETIRYCRLSIISGLFFSLIVFSMFLVRLYLEGVASTTLYALLVASIILALLPWLIKYTANYKIANLLYIILPLIILPMRVLETGGFNSTVISWYFVICMLIFLIASIRWGVITYFLVLFEISLLYIAIEQNWVKADFIPKNDIQLWVFVIALSASIGLIYWYEKQRIINIRKLEELNKQISYDNELLSQQKKELKKVNHDKTTLLNVLCHDIVNPLNIITGCTEMSIASQDIDKKDSHANSIAKASNVIKQIISHVRIIQIADIKASELELTPVNIMECLEQVFFIFSNKLLLKNITIDIDKESLAGRNILAEPVSLNNFVINNIISNAIKFSEKDGRIEISTETKDDLFCLKIRDFGIGMTADTLDDLFAIDKISSHTGTQGEEGTGLGMKIMSFYVNAYGGQVKVESTRNENNPGEQGTIFYLYFKEA